MFINQRLQGLCPDSPSQRDPYTIRGDSRNRGKKKRRITRTVFRAVESSFLFIIFMLSIPHRFTLPRINQIQIVLLTGLTCQDVGVDQKTFLM
ncbi:hypothetical protein L1987_14013 [Smallanthus sonchifolius]|uniref:Uncharacterized protein n=1 Tax=Smallanthus sonchifolius TaxID=185202 RepID=A0ACB9JIN8_9ASTR|nr:hypothetical protein L1987_14013 [Smallanthus sonchifolius]